MLNELKEVRVSDMYVKCSLLKQSSPGAASYRCGQSAYTAVESSDGIKMYRCQEHRGLLKDGTVGLVHETVLTREDVRDQIVVSWPERA